MTKSLTTKARLSALVHCLCLLAVAGSLAEEPLKPFNVIAFYTGKNDAAHVSFVREANQWFPQRGVEHHFNYTATTNWNDLNAEFLSRYQVVLFLDTRPETPEQRAAFQKYMEQGGAWMGFHFSAFALTPSDYPQNWDWYHNEFLGAGQYSGNTWRPTSATLRVADAAHPTTTHLPATFKAAPNEWYQWERDLRTNAAIRILLAIDESSFPLGTGPKPYEIWHSGYYPVAWHNRYYRMIYVNMGHNDLAYEEKPPKELSHTFGEPEQSQFIVNALLWLGRGGKAGGR